MKSVLVLSSLIALACPMRAFAHHGKDFLVTSTFGTPKQGHLFSLLSTDYLASHHDESGFEFSPGLLYGITNRWSTEFHTHHHLSEGKFQTEALAIETHYRFLGITDHQEEDGDHHDLAPFSLAGLVEFEKGLNGSPDGAEARLIAGQDFHRFSFAGNLIFNKHFEGGENVEFSYAVGVRTILNSLLTAALEFDAGTSHNGNSHLTPGVSISLSHTLDLRVGASFNLSGEHDDSTILRSLLIYEF